MHNAGLTQPSTLLMQNHAFGRCKEWNSELPVSAPVAKNAGVSRRSGFMLWRSPSVPPHSGAHPEGQRAHRTEEM